MDKLFDNIKKGVSVAVTEAEKLTRAVVDKTTTIVDSTKLNLSLNDTEGKINKLYAKIGELVYNEYTGGTEFDGEIGSICTEIDNFSDEAAKLKAKIAELKNTVPCPNCSQLNERGNGYCSACGEKISVGDESDFEDTVIEVTEFPQE